MAVQSQIAFFNYASVATITPFSATGQPPYQTGWPTSNLKYPQQPFVVGKTADRIGNTVVVDTLIDLGGYLPAMSLVMLVNVNYPQVRLFASNDLTFATTVWDTGTVSIGKNPWHRRYTYVTLHPGVAGSRYLLIRVPSNLTTVDGANYYSTGGVFIGTLTALPSDIRWDERPRVVEPHIDIPLIGGGTSRVSTGRPYVELRARRLALVAHETPATGDDLGAWLSIDEHFRIYGNVAWYANRGNTAEGFIFRKMNESDWNVNQVVSEDELILHEVVGP